MYWALNPNSRATRSAQSQSTTYSPISPATSPSAVARSGWVGACVFSVVTAQVTAQLTFGYQYEPACPPTEDGVIDVIAQSLKDLFRLKNDGEDFFWAVANATHTYDADVHGHFMTELFTKRELVQQLLRVLKSDKDKQ